MVSIGVEVSTYVSYYLHTIVTHDLFHSGDWIYQLFMHQACMFENKSQYEKSNNILTSVINEALKKHHIGKDLYKAISQFQVQLNEKTSYLAYWARNSVTVSFDTMTMSLMKSINCHIKHKIKLSVSSISIHFLFEYKQIKFFSFRHTLGTIQVGC
jgi:hypothetical protein